jgi:murein DD-endopeptidase / murein LD-carboxypeptidase
MRLLKNSFFFFSFALIVAVCFNSCRPGKEISKTENRSDSKTNTSSQRIKKDYSKIIGVYENKISNIELYSFIDEWYGVPYKFGGKNKDGIDCSNFTTALYKSVYKKNLTGTSSSIFTQCKEISKNDLREGDLLFFKIEKNEISHIGIYLQNNKFIHATTKKGVMINDMDEAYYKKYFFKAGRVNQNLFSKNISD